MGCDIHWVVEVKCGNRWVGILSNDGSKSKAADRWYDFFGELAGVRRESDTAYTPKGLPDDPSDLTRYAIVNSSWDHTESWLSVDEFVAAYNRAIAKNKKFYLEANPINNAELFGLAWWPINDCDEQRVIFAFDN